MVNLTGEENINPCNQPYANVNFWTHGILCFMLPTVDYIDKMNFLEKNNLMHGKPLS